MLLSKILISTFLLSNVHIKQVKQQVVGLHKPGQHSISAIGQVSPSSIILHSVAHCDLTALIPVTTTGATISVMKQNNNMFVMVFNYSNILSLISLQNTLTSVNQFSLRLFKMCCVYCIQSMLIVIKTKYHERYKKRKLLQYL